MHIPILFENENLLVVNKPAGLVVHGDGRTDEPSVVDWIREHYPDIRGVGEDMMINHKGNDIRIPRPGIVHRLDRDTSGVLVIAKTRASFEFLKNQFKDRKIQKIYRALTYGHIKEDQGIIDQAIGRDSKDFRKKIAGTSARGKLRTATTQFTVLERFVDPQSKKDIQGKHAAYTWVECKPITGRTHQIRVHLKWLNHPIVADSLYQGKRKENLGLSRMALHAAQITLHYVKGEEITIQAPLPDDITNARSRLAKN